MKLLYVASDQLVPGTTGGSVHVDEVARGLSALGHELHVVARAGEPGPETGSAPYRLHPSTAWHPHRAFRWSGRGGIDRLMERYRFDAVMERFHNFGGEGVRAAYARGIPSLLEVNAPLKDHPGSLKMLLDQLLLFRPMRRLREEQCRKASAIVTPLQSILPDDLPREKIHRVFWGANVERFRPGVEPASCELPEGRVIVFSGSFRPWHGADVLVRAARQVLDGPFGKETVFLLIGGGPALQQARRLARELGIDERVRFVGPIRYEEMPGYLALGDIGVAPYQPSRLGPMKLGFFWSPLKIFEYMAMGIPTITLDVEPLKEIVRPGQEGLVIGEADPDALADSIEVLLAEPARAHSMGRSSRERVESRFSWKRHCEQLQEILRGIQSMAAAP